MSTRIPYLDEVWNVTTGCGDDQVSPGCDNCYARRMFGRNLWRCPSCNDGMTFTLQTCSRCGDTGYQDFRPTFHADRLDQPLHWRKPRVVGVSFMGDLFHEAITNEQIHEVILRTIQAHQHTYLILTKRPKRMRSFFIWLRDEYEFVPGNLWLGVTVCNQEEADRNITILLATPAAKRLVSLEPLLSAINMRTGVYQMPPNGAARGTTLEGIDLVVLGGETGPGARPMQPDWALDVYRQCKAAGVAFWFKGMGRAKVPPRWDWSGAPGTELLAEMQATHELPAVRP